MSKYAIVQLQGKQYKVTEGSKLIIDRLAIEEGKSFDCKEVLLYADGKTLKVGTPVIESAKVSFKVLENGRAKKIRVAKFRSKSRYRKVQGHRQHQSTLEVAKISV